MSNFENYETHIKELKEKLDRKDKLIYDLKDLLSEHEISGSLEYVLCDECDEDVPNFLSGSYFKICNKCKRANICEYCYSKRSISYQMKRVWTCKACIRSNLNKETRNIIGNVLVDTSI